MDSIENIADVFKLKAKDKIFESGDVEGRQGKSSFLSASQFSGLKNVCKFS